VGSSPTLYTNLERIAIMKRYTVEIESLDNTAEVERVHTNNRARALKLAKYIDEYYWAVVFDNKIPGQKNKIFP
jgi:hypothetical protein